MEQVAVFCRSRWGEINDSRDPDRVDVAALAGWLAWAGVPDQVGERAVRYRSGEVKAQFDDDLTIAHKLANDFDAIPRAIAESKVQCGLNHLLGQS